MSNIRSELSTKNKYWISKLKYYELKYFCLQYNEWKNAYYCLDDTSLPSAINRESLCNSVANPTEKLALTKTIYFERIKLIEDTAKETDPELWEYILKAITQDLSYPYLSGVLGIPCSRGTYYNRYRKFFWLLSKKR